MSDQSAVSSHPSLIGVHSGRLFVGSCLSLIATSVAFAVIGDIMGALKTQFVLTNAQVGLIGGAALLGFTPAIIILGPLCDVLGMKRLLAFAWFCHLAGPAIMMCATIAPANLQYPCLYWGAMVIGFGNGTVEAVCNPLVATLYPDNKTTMLNRFHVWFPGGIVLGALICFGLAQVGIMSWKLRLMLIMIPAVFYGILMLSQKFPVTERVQSGISFGGMVKATFGRPLFLIMFLCMGITASLELGPNRWISAILESGGIHGILVLAWISGLMAVLRFFAGPFVHKFSPTGLLLGSAVLGGAGLFWLSYAETLPVAFAAATVFAFGVCYFWPTMLGFVAERVPRGGALALAMMGGMGMLAAGQIASPLIGKIADDNLKDKLEKGPTTAVIQKIADDFPTLQAAAKGDLGKDFQPGIDAAKQVLEKIKASGGELPHPDTANALRAAIGSGAKADVIKEASAILNPAENYGGRISFRKIAPSAIVLILVFGFMYINDKRRGGYQAEKIGN